MWGNQSHGAPGNGILDYVSDPGSRLDVYDQSGLYMKSLCKLEQIQKINQLDLLEVFLSWEGVFISINHARAVSNVE